MKTYSKYSLWFVLLLIAAFSACEPIEDRMEMSGAITAEQLDITATLLQVDGKNSNKVVLDNKSPVLSSWDYGSGVTQRKTDTVLLVATGENEIRFTGLNADGTKITKTLTVNVDELTFEVPLEWGYLTGGSEKTWVWDDTRPAVWGNGGYMGDSAPAWWALPISDIDGQAAGEGAGAEMVFSLSGSRLTKVKSSGESQTGSFAFDMSQIITLDNGNVWAKGKLTTRGVTVLCGISPNEGNAPVYEYSILMLDDDHMVLSYSAPGTGAWGEAWFWMFKAVD
ncbi:hypothetical protein [Parapedobacter koreensis]|uniref:PKD domain-containing protein n=1 Tax=Parapedobacter koreensis TaxID=332977 RepID=A0A1H7Q2Y3_9SPHI|nr:hypothetical protein [Parapedobacter koreensis]SEL42333.1 hypothetical protein SAMN05421740_105148 [Parapedobacter koreensis]